MSSSMLNIARSALLTHQRAAEVISNNIANSETPGYTRQRAVLRPVGGGVAPVTAPLFGGVELQEVQRVRSAFFDAVYRREVTVEAQSSTVAQWLQTIEGLLGSPTNSPLGASLDTFYNAFGDLANAPTSDAAKVLVQDAGRNVVEQFNRFGSQVAALKADALRALEDGVGQLARFSSEIGQLNVQILAASDGAPALQDRRDVLLDELSSLVGARIVQQTRGDFTIIAGSSILLDGVTSPVVTVGQDAAGKFVLRKADGSTVDPEGGRLLGLLDVLNREIPAVSESLDALARGMATAVNDLHRTGVLASGATNIDFFDPGVQGATSLRLSTLVALDPSNIATGTVQANGPNDLALAIASSRNTPLGSLGDKSVLDSFNALLIGVATSTRVQTASATASGVLLETVNLQRQSEAGVSQDEEMIALIQTQAAFQAAARVLTVADEMLQEILNIRR